MISCHPADAGIALHPLRTMWVRLNENAKAKAQGYDGQNWIGQNWGQNWLWPKLAPPKPRWPKMDWPKLDWPKLVKSEWPKRDWPKLVPSPCGAPPFLGLAPLSSTPHFGTHVFLPPSRHSFLICPKCLFYFVPNVFLFVPNVFFCPECIFFNFVPVVVWLSCEAPAAPKPPGFHTTAREPKRAHLRVPVFKNTTKIQRKGPTREGGSGKTESEILGCPVEGGPAEGGPAEGGPAEGGPAERP